MFPLRQLPPHQTCGGFLLPKKLILLIGAWFRGTGLNTDPVCPGVNTVMVDELKPVKL